MSTRACPYCGGIQIKMLVEEIKNDEEELRPAYWYECKDCGGCGGWRRTERGALLAWNRRTYATNNRRRPHRDTRATDQ